MRGSIGRGGSCRRCEDEGIRQQPRSIQILELEKRYRPRGSEHDAIKRLRRLLRGGSSPRRLLILDVQSLFAECRSD